MLFISILNYHNAAATAQCLNGLSTVCERLDFRIIVADHSATSEIETITLGIPPTLAKRSEFYHRPSNPGFARGHNGNFAVARPQPEDIFLILNNDVYFPDPLIFEDMIMHCAPRTILGSVITRSSDGQIWFAGGHINRFTGDARPRKVRLSRAIVETDFLCGCCIMMRAEVFSALGGFDETFFMYAEDLDFSVRAVRAGFRLRVINRALSHDVGGHLNGQYSDVFLGENTKNRIICLERHQLGLPGIREAIFFGMYLIGRTIQLLMFSTSPIHQIGVVLSGYRAGWRRRATLPLPMSEFKLSAPVNEVIQT
ncbi:MAG TPA: glycosyltransferase family 2 protein [Terriglobales bacterium]|nr:glycosyltransferase family 2 protein [Terriglobales bacterium]